MEQRLGFTSVDDKSMRRIIGDQPFQCRILQIFSSNSCSIMLGNQHGSLVFSQPHRIELRINALEQTYRQSSGDVSSRSCRDLQAAPKTKLQKAFLESAER